MSIDEAALRTAWRSSLLGPTHGAAAPVVAPELRRASEAAFEALITRYREPHRRYHGVTHLVWVLRHVRELTEHEPVADLAAVRMAVFFHDAVYDPQAGDNEHVSARLAESVLGRFAEYPELGWAPDRIAHVTAMIEATATHELPGNAPRADSAVLLDADLAILGADPAAYRAYVDGVRVEYRHVDDESWRHGRSAVLEGFLRRTELFHTPTARTRWTARARANLTAELAGLHH
jgi:predicted metal-dependent HD superfamily phosphohydrolase